MFFFVFLLKHLRSCDDGGNTICMVKSQNISVKLDFLEGSGTKCVNKFSATLLLAVLHIGQLPKQFSSVFF